LGGVKEVWLSPTNCIAGNVEFSLPIAGLEWFVMLGDMSWFWKPYISLFVDMRVWALYVFNVPDVRRDMSTSAW
jgi:hypothetical protein